MHAHYLAMFTLNVEQLCVHVYERKHLIFGIRPALRAIAHRSFLLLQYEEANVRRGYFERAVIGSSTARFGTVERTKQLKCRKRFVVN